MQKELTEKEIYERYKNKYKSNCKTWGIVFNSTVLLSICCIVVPFIADFIFNIKMHLLAASSIISIGISALSVYKETQWNRVKTIIENYSNSNPEKDNFEKQKNVKEEKCVHFSKTISNKPFILRAETLGINDFGYPRFQTASINVAPNQLEQMNKVPSSGQVIIKSMCEDYSTNEEESYERVTTKLRALNGGKISSKTNEPKERVLDIIPEEDGKVLRLVPKTKKAD